MPPLKAHVKNGRLTLDDPTDLPEGQIVFLQRVDGIVTDDRDDLDEEDRAALHAELEASIEEATRATPRTSRRCSPSCASGREVRDLEAGPPPDREDLALVARESSRRAIYLP